MCVSSLYDDCSVKKLFKIFALSVLSRTPNVRIDNVSTCL